MYALLLLLLFLYSPEWINDCGETFHIPFGHNGLITVDARSSYGGVCRPKRPLKQEYLHILGKHTPGQHESETCQRAFGRQQTTSCISVLSAARHKNRRCHFYTLVEVVLSVVQFFEQRASVLVGREQSTDIAHSLTYGIITLMCEF